MGSGSRKPEVVLELRFGVPATPSNVVRAARLVMETLEASGVASDRQDVTMVVHNHALVAEIRAWSRAGSRAAKRVVRTVKYPGREIRKSAEARAIAEVWVEHEAELVRQAVEVRLPGERDPVARVDQGWIERLRNLTSERPQDLVSGTSAVYSQVLRVGRKSEASRTISARIRLDDVLRDVPVVDHAVHDLVVAMESQRTVMLYIDASWRPAHDGRLEFDAARSVVTGVDPEWRGGTGEQFLATARSSFAVSAADLDELESALEDEGA